MRLIFSIIAFFIVTFASAQEILSGLQVNPVVRAKAEELRTREPRGYLGDTLPVLLPFFDDFRENLVFPNPDRWSDRYAFVNTDFPVYPVNLGAVTIDAINDSGTIYSNGVPGPLSFIADHLTSRYIRLDSVFTPVPRAITVADSIYLSFWYQPQGRGRAPQPADSLCLDFFVRAGYDSITPEDTIHIPDIWKRIWSSPGMTLDTFYLNNNKYFAQVMIPITDSARFYKKTFQFRFYNYVSLASNAEPSWQSNTDQWSIDEVYLNIGRTASDTIRPELTFIERPPSLLKRYSVMPYLQYSNDPTNEINDTLDILMANRDLVSHDAAYSYNVTQEGGSFNKTYNGGNYLMNPVYTNGYVTYPPFAHPPVPFIIPIGATDSASFPVKHFLRAVDGSGLGDTIGGSQDFYNYFAYDDGTADAGYGLSPHGSKMALQFRMNAPDTLRAVRFYFNHTLSHANEQVFYLSVWNDNGGKPGELVYAHEQTVSFSDSLNDFYTYLINPPLFISSTFYVGTEQTTDDNLNIGFDRYNNSNQYLFYNVTGQWLTSAYSGSVMVRPVIGKPLPLGIAGNPGHIASLSIYPNPAAGNTVSIRTGDTPQEAGGTVEVYTLYGQKIFSGAVTGTLDIAAYPPGMYLVTVADSHGIPVARGKLLVSR